MKASEMTSERIDELQQLAERGPLKPTIEELEVLLREESPAEIEILQSGEIGVRSVSVPVMELIALAKLSRVGLAAIVFWHSDQLDQVDWQTNDPTDATGCALQATIRACDEELI